METQLGPGTATASAPAASPPQGLPEVSAAETSADLIKSAGPATDGTPVEGGEPGGPEGAAEGEEQKPEAAPWSEAQDLDTLLGVEQVAAAVEERETQAFDRGRSETHSRMQPFLQRQEGEMRAARADQVAFMESWNNLIEGGTLTTAEANQLIQKNRASIAVLGGLQETAGLWAGISQFAERVARFLGDSNMEQEFATRVGSMSRDVQDPTFIEDFVKKVGEAATKPICDQLKEANAAIVRHEEAEKKAERTRQPPPAKTGGRAGGGPDSATREQRVREGTASTEELRAYLNDRNK